MLGTMQAYTNRYARGAWVMSVGNRVYIIEGDSITPVAQKTFDEFFFSERPALRAYSGRTLTFAMPTYELEKQAPDPYRSLRHAPAGGQGRRLTGPGPLSPLPYGHLLSHRCGRFSRSGNGKKIPVSEHLGGSLQESPGSPEDSRAGRSCGGRLVGGGEYLTKRRGTPRSATRSGRRRWSAGSDETPPSRRRPDDLGL